MQVVVKRPIRGMRDKRRIEDLILGVIIEVFPPSICLNNVVFAFPECSQDRARIQIITDIRSDEVIGAGEEPRIKTAICLALKPIMDIKEEDITIRGFDVFDDYC